MMKKSFLLLLFSFNLCVLSNCYKVERGYNEEKDTLKEIQEMVKNHDTMNEFVFKLGSPTFTNQPENNIICYVSGKGTKVAFNRFYKPTYLSICIKFKNNKAQDMIVKNISNIKKEKMTDFKIDFKKPL